MKSAVLVGEEGLLILCADHLLERNWRIVGVVSVSADVSSWAKKAKVTVFENLSQLQSTLHEPPDYLFSITNFAVIPEPVLSWVRFASFNFHDGPLPEVAGLNTPSWALLNNKNSHGITWHKMTPELDGGGVVVRSDFDIDVQDTVLDLNARCFEFGFEGFQKLVQSIESNTIRTLEAKTPHEYFARSQKPKYLGYINWRDSAAQILNLFRATDYAGYRNGLTETKVLLSDGYVNPREMHIEKTVADANKPGLIISRTPTSCTVQTGDGVICMSWPDLSANNDRLKPGKSLPDINAVFPSEFESNEYGHLHDDMAWVSKIRGKELATFQHLSMRQSGDELSCKKLIQISSTLESEVEALAAVALLLGRMDSQDSVNFAVSNDRFRSLSARLKKFILSYCPVSLDVECSSTSLMDASAKTLETLQKCPPLNSELFVRIPALKHYAQSYLSPQFVFTTVSSFEEIEIGEGERLLPGLVFDRAQNALYWVGSNEERPQDELDRMLQTALSMVRQRSELSTLPFVNANDKELYEQINKATGQAYSSCTVDSLILEFANKKLDEVALCWKGDDCTYGGLLSNSERVAQYLLGQKLKPDSLIGVMLENKIETVYAMLGIWRAGFAYVPLDPSYPTDRLTYIANDAGLECIFAEPNIAKTHGFQDISLSPGALEDNNIPIEIGNRDPSDRAYVIYTSGSTGKPKGVQVSHDNVVNFLLGMDGVIGSQSGTLLSVTSISFDISVLEIWWSLSRGLKVVFYDDENSIGDPHKSEDPGAPIQFSLYFWNTQDPAAPSTVEETYDMLKQAVTYADTHGFEAVWSPERHFGSFGGPFPNPGITSAALATITNQVKIRAGSCVIPLHHPIRVAEDWSMVDNLSNGRVGISFASGWMPQDFAIAPQNFARAKEVMFESIDQVRRLWRGEAVEFEGPKGPAAIKTLPRPVQKELPSWVTTAGSPDTFAQAGELGLNVLTHLLGQSADELEKKIQIYRDARKKAGHPGSGCVTLMLHTFVTKNKEYARKISRGPMKSYLKSAMNLVKAAAWEFPTFKKMESSSKDDMDEYFGNLTEEDMDDLLEFAFQRYFDESGLFGSPSENLDFVEKLQGIGVNEIGCLIDFGIQPAEVLANLDCLNELKLLSTHQSSNNLSKIVDHYSVTHMQCTPSQANMFSLDNADIGGLKKLDYLLVGGEALSQNLADSLVGVVSGKVINMYGPTETTVWSLTKEIRQNEPVQIGKPIANTSVHVLDHRQRDIPVGWLGELYIGGKGVSLGYLNRPDLDSERFVNIDGDRLYATGDTVRFCNDGNVEFLGRNDHQVKIRGYRIELGEVESSLKKIPGIDEAVVVGEADQWGEIKLVGYFTGKAPPELQQIRSQLSRFLPTFMLPSKLVHLSEIPRTLNGKVDRKALKKSIPAATQPRVKVAEKTFDTKPVQGQGSTKTQHEMLDIWQGLLELNDIDLGANFFDIGGHSILAVRLQGILSKKYGRRVPISELFRYPTIAGLSAYIDSFSSSDKQVRSEFADGAVSRAARRKARFNR